MPIVRSEQKVVDVDHSASCGLGRRGLEAGTFELSRCSKMTCGRPGLELDPLSILHLLSTVTIS